MQRRTLALGLLAAGLLAVWAGPAMAQSVTFDLGDLAQTGEEGEGLALTARAVQLFVLLTVLSLAPGIAMMVTCFPFMVTVLSILRQAIGVQQAPPNMMIVSLALFLTYFVMEPVFTEAWTAGIGPMLDGNLTQAQGFERAAGPVRAFMETRVDAGNSALVAAVSPGRVGADGALPFSVLIPAFMVAEIERGFEVGFMIFLPFLAIDIVVASILMSMGMMMVPPVVVSLPLKLAFFVMADGWDLLAGTLVRSYAT
ncbi:MAG: flagellar type III secretion system pore protein FliP [Alphaproteobacteria bacterium]|nr:flagellar type III secretion system pore protein FliP [Alphaproteobacteria bacterium]MDX5369957.1 flagellar type III secretion system pore protein FliP [Alphaproteobacteria bacterium]MDX5464532.1 flagellar type III secretion system pore protein FliP [Alphaproteobacteria bacterium]